jgi:hypothetical protein
MPGSLGAPNGKNPAFVIPTDHPAGRAAAPTSWAAPPHGHAHFWRRALGRRPFLRAAAGTAGALLAAGAASSALAAAERPEPRPIPHGLDIPGLPRIHVRAPRFPGVGGDADDDPITITDFSGKIGYAIIDGTGTGTDTATGATKRYSTNVDMRFMTGLYKGLDGRMRGGTFVFI